jgi:hypothetical protein
MKISGKNHANAPERGPVAPIQSQRSIDGLEKIRTHHRDLVDDKGLDGTDKALISKLLCVGGVEQSRREIEKGVNCLTPDIHCSQTGWGKHDSTITFRLNKLSEQSGFARACSTGQEDIPAPAENMMDEAVICRGVSHIDLPSSKVG